MTPDRVVELLKSNGMDDPAIFYSVGKYSAKIYCNLMNRAFGNDKRYEFDSWQALVDFAEGYRRNEILFRRFK